MSVHPTAIIDPRAKFPASCKVGPYCMIGADNSFLPFCAIGMAPQDVSYKGEPTRLEIGEHNEIREFVTINRGTVKGGGITRVGSHILLMAYAHIAHDCQI